MLCNNCLIKERCPYNKGSFDDVNPLKNKIIEIRDIRIRKKDNSYKEDELKQLIIKHKQELKEHYIECKNNQKINENIWGDKI